VPAAAVDVAGQLSMPHTTAQLLTAQSVEGGMDSPRAPDGVPQWSPVEVQPSQLVQLELQLWPSSSMAAGGTSPPLLPSLAKAARRPRSPAL